jgi:hypothetical protein
MSEYVDRYYSTKARQGQQQWLRQTGLSIKKRVEAIVSVDGK